MRTYRRTWLVSTIVLPLMAACTTTAEPVSQATPIPASAQSLYRDASPGTVPVVVVRDRGPVGTACPTNLYVGEQLAARIGAGQVATLHIPAGFVILGVEPDGLCAGGLVEQSVTLVAGRPVTLRLEPDRSGGVALRPDTSR
jgi:hypothetical protein